MANVELKTDFKDGEVLFGEQLNNNFKAIKAALEAANKIAWQDNLDDEIVAFKGTTEEVEHRPIINGQLVYDVEQGFTYIDIITYTEEEGYPTLKPQRIKLSGGDTNNNIPLLSNIDLSEINKPGVYMVDHDTTTDNLRVGDTYAVSYIDYYIVVRKYTNETMFQYSWDTTMSYTYFRMLDLDENGNTISVGKWTKSDYMIPNIKTGDYADLLAEGTYIVNRSLTDRLNTFSSISGNYNKVMYVTMSGGSSRANVKQTLVDGFDIYVRTVYTDASYTTAQSATEWEKRTIGEGGTGGSSIHIGEEEPTDGSNVWIDPSDDGTIDGLLNTLFPIGKVEIFYDDLDHSNHLGFTWERTSLERSPIGYNPDSTSDNYKTIGNKFGEAEHKLTIEEMPSHIHPMIWDTQLGSSYGAVMASTRQDGTQLTNDSMGSVGDSQPHNTIHPVEVMAFWKRIG